MSDDSAALAEARATVARQQAEIGRLEERLVEEHFARELRDALIAGAAAGTLAAPVSHGRLLEMIVATAAQVIAVRAGALFLIDEARGVLVFEVALGHKADEARRFEVPLGRGIAGLVAVTGQPIAVADVAHDPRHAPEIGRSIGYIPQNMLCVPLFYNDRIIGVLEFLDKLDAAAFSAADMEILGLFANTAAVAIEQSRTHQNLAALIAEVLASLGGLDEARRAQLAAPARRFAATVDADPAYSRALELARLVQRIVWQGEDEFNACRSILNGFADYLQARQRSAGAPEGW